MDSIDKTLDSELRTRHAGYLLGLISWMCIVLALGTVTLIEMLAAALPWWSIVTATFGVTTAGGSVVVLARQWRPKTKRG
jgi:sterol desaturase/sphingolipid hydroxylase (fatty acid hydroxylase superfamily)